MIVELTTQREPKLDMADVGSGGNVLGASERRCDGGKARGANNALTYLIDQRSWLLFIEPRVCLALSDLEQLGKAAAPITSIITWNGNTSPRIRRCMCVSKRQQQRLARNVIPPQKKQILGANSSVQ
jgi:hypothetical protein